MPIHFSSAYYLIYSRSKNYIIVIIIVVVFRKPRASITGGNGSWQFNLLLTHSCLQIGAKVKITQWLSCHLRLSLHCRNSPISSFAHRKNTGCVNCWLNLFCDMIIKWELWFYFLPLLHQGNLRNKSHLVESAVRSRKLASLSWILGCD